MNSTDLLRFINDHQIEADIVYLSVVTPTVTAAATAVNVTPDQIGKSLLFLIDGEPLLVIANGTTRIDYKALARHLEVNRKRIRLANSEQVFQFTGYEVGTVPPFGHKMLLPTLIERSVVEQREIYAGGGDVNALLRISVKELERVTEAPNLKLKRPSSDT
ncbi:MAG: YbaK/EbsC family protein [Candidatus Promineifilaceae bacterium]